MGAAGALQTVCLGISVRLSPSLLVCKWPAEGAAILFDSHSE